MLYRVTFTTGETFNGGNLKNSLWNKIPDKPIQKIEYYILEKPILLQNCQAYNHLIEKEKLFNQGEIISKTFLMGKINNEVLIYEFDLIHLKVAFYSTKWNEEYYNKATTGWKRGI